VEQQQQAVAGLVRAISDDQRPVQMVSGGLLQRRQQEEWSLDLILYMTRSELCLVAAVAELTKVVVDAERLDQTQQ
jgi:hypothetical protein